MSEIQALKQRLLGNLKPSKPLRVWGVDLGTTNSTVSEITWTPGDPIPKCRPLELEQPTTEGIYTSPLVPSVVAVLDGGETWVGEGAKRLRARPQEASLVPEKNLFYETKNEMGLRKTYHRAPENLNCAWKIAARILSFLEQAALSSSGSPPNRVVVTVPASFQLNQRNDTLKAASSAGLSIGDYELLDEPTAALLDYLMTKAGEGFFQTGRMTRALVFDFGGGTCDVSILELEQDPRARRLKTSQLSTSRYHRLGGGDLDAAIVHDHLIPRLMRENDLPRLSWVEKKRGLEPQLLGTAEALKIALSSEIDRLKKLGRYDRSDPKEIVARQPFVACKLGRQEYTIARPELSAEAWNVILKPFLDRNFLYARETDYRLTQSVFAPLQDALDRVRLEPREIDLVLLVGGSTLIPQVCEEIESFFSQARVCTFDDPLEVQLAVSRGAAWHAFFLEVDGKPFIQPVVSDGIALLTGSGEPLPLPLISPGSPVPYPQDGSFARLTNLAISVPMARQLKFDVVAQSSLQPLFSETWNLDRSLNTGEPITLEYRLSANQELECRAFLTNDPSVGFSRKVENPLVNTVSPNATRLEIEEHEETLRKAGGPKPEDSDRLVHLAELYADLKQLERALEYLRTALRLLNQPDPEILFHQGLYFGMLGDFEQEEKAYLECSRVAPYLSSALFNLSLSLCRQRRYPEALDAVEKALQREPRDGPYLTQKAMCFQSLGKKEEVQKTFKEARESFPAPEGMLDWDLGWAETCAGLLKDDAWLRRIQEERKKRKISPVPDGEPGVPRPMVKGDLVLRKP